MQLSFLNLLVINWDEVKLVAVETYTIIICKIVATIHSGPFKLVSFEKWNNHEKLVPFVTAIVSTHKPLSLSSCVFPVAWTELAQRNILYWYCQGQLIHLAARALLLMLCSITQFV